METLSVFLNAYLLPCALIFCGISLALRIRIIHILAPRRFFRTLMTSASSGGISPSMAMCTALAGTLGVGNIAGVATAISAGGAGAVMWMWIGSAISLSVKYGEVALSVKYRHTENQEYVGGTMYTARDGLSRYIGVKRGARFATVFATLCIANSLLMGNIVQVKSAASVFDINALPICFAFGIVIILLTLCRLRTLTSITYFAIPILSALYIILSLSAIIKGHAFLPSVLSNIITEAFAWRPFLGGSAGYGMLCAVRYGITRGIFSNEAGCGTSPTAHATAETPSAHHQGCFGMFEVIADTPILCSMTAFVILIAEKSGLLFPADLNGVPLTLASFEVLLNAHASLIIGSSVIFFALATVTAQLMYGKVALEYITRNRAARCIFNIVYALCAVFATLIPNGIMWYAADIIIAVMTLMNIRMLFTMRKEIEEISLEKTTPKSRKSKDIYCKK